MTEPLSVTLNDPTPTPVPWYRGKKVVVTGASGLIGSYCVKVLKASGAYVRAVVNRRAPNRYTRLADELLVRDLMLPQDARSAVNGADAVIGGAGITGGVNLPSIDPVSYVGPASVLVINTIQACVQEGVERFGFLSSTTVYGPQEAPVKEDDADKHPPYPLYRGIAYSKRFLERLCRYYHETTGLKVGVVRPAGAYGRYDNFDEKTSHVLPGMICRALRAEPEFAIWGDGNDVRDFIHSQDVARSLLLATVKGDATPVNAASGRPVSTRELASIVLDATGSQAPLVTQPGKPTALRSRKVDVSFAESHLGFRAEVSLEEGVRDTVAWLKHTLAR